MKKIFSGISLALFLCILVAGCSSPTMKSSSKERCPIGRTLLDGTCVKNEVADYVTCVRSQNVEVNSDIRNSFKASAGYLGINADAARDVSENLRKKYSATDTVVLKAIEKCDALSGITSNAQPTLTPISRKPFNIQNTEAGPYTVKLYSCNNSSNTVKCEFTVTNNSDGENMRLIKSTFYGTTRIFSPDGSVTDAYSVHIGDKGGSRQIYYYKLPQDIPVKGYVVFKNYTHSTIASLEIILNTNHQVAKTYPAKFKNIDLIN